MIPEGADAPAAGGKPVRVGPDLSGGSGPGVMKRDTDILLRAQGIMGAAHPVNILCVDAEVRSQALHPIEVGIHAFAQITLRAGSDLEIDVGVCLGGHGGIFAAGEDEPITAHLEDFLKQCGRVVTPRSLIGEKFL